MLRAVVRFAREVAQLPSFPSERPLRVTAQGLVAPVDDDDDDDDELAEGSVLKVVATDAIPGEALPNPETTWFALRPFQDLDHKKLSAETKTERVRTRRAFVELLARLAESEPYRWDPATMHCGEMIGTERSKTTENAFWLDLLRALWPGAAQDVTQPLERNLIALSRARRPRFLLCLDHDVARIEFSTLLEQFLLPQDEDTPPVLFEPTIVDGLPEDEDVDGLEIEIGLSFTKGRFSAAAMTELLDVIDRVQATRRLSAISFRVTTLRFGRNCSFMGKAVEALAQHRRRGSNCVRSIRLGDVSDARTTIKRSLFSELIRGHSYLRRLGTSTYDSFVPMASAVRGGGAARLEEVDVKYSVTLENAAWLAFAFFHVDSQSTVSSLCLRLPRSGAEGEPAYLTYEWLAVFERVLQSVGAEQDLAHIEGGANAPQQQHEDESSSIVSTRTFVRVQPNLVAKAQHCSDTPPSLAQAQHCSDTPPSLAQALDHAAHG